MVIFEWGLDRAGESNIKYHSSTAKRICHRRDAASTEKVYCLAQTYASPRIEPRFVFGVLCALSVSAVHGCSEVIITFQIIMFNVS